MVGTVPASFTVMLPFACAVTLGCAAPHAANCSSVADWAIRSDPLAVAVTPETLMVCVFAFSFQPDAVSVTDTPTDGAAQSVPFTAAVTPPAPSPFSSPLAVTLVWKSPTFLPLSDRLPAASSAARLPAAAGTVLSALFPILARSLLNCVSVPVYPPLLAAVQALSPASPWMPCGPCGPVAPVSPFSPFSPWGACWTLGTLFTFFTLRTDCTCISLWSLRTRISLWAL